MTSKTNTRRAADVLVESLRAHGVDRIFCVPGESYLALLDALHDAPDIDLVAARHEGGAGYLTEVGIERFYRDARLIRIYEVTSQIQQLIIAREMLKELDA